MAALTLYGSNVANGTLTNACTMASTTGGVETSTTTTLTSTNTEGEIFSQGGSTATVSSIPATPTGHGWVYQPGAGTFANANWSAVFTMALAADGATSQTTIRFFKYSGGVYSSIGTITVASQSLTKHTWTFAATSMPATTFGSSDFVYVDLWYHDASSNAGTDNPTVYLSNSATAGVANDLVVTTSNFTASGGTTHFFISDGFGGVFS